jgi:hypothetical protein
MYGMKPWIEANSKRNRKAWLMALALIIMPGGGFVVLLYGASLLGSAACRVFQRAA